MQHFFPRRRCLPPPAGQPPPSTRRSRPCSTRRRTSSPACCERWSCKSPPRAAFYHLNEGNVVPPGQHRLELPQRRHCRAAQAGRHSHITAEPHPPGPGGEGRASGGNRRGAAAPSVAAPLATAASMGCPSASPHDTQSATTTMAAATILFMTEEAPCRQSSGSEFLEADLARHFVRHQLGRGASPLKCMAPSTWRAARLLHPPRRRKTVTATPAAAAAAAVIGCVQDH